MSKKNIGSNLDEFLSENAILNEATAVAIKRVITWKVELEVNEAELASTPNKESKSH